MTTESHQWVRATAEGTRTRCSPHSNPKHSKEVHGAHHPDPKPNYHNRDVVEKSKKATPFSSGVRCGEPVVRMEISYASSSSRNLSRYGTSSSSSFGGMPNRPVKIIPLQHPSTASFSSFSSSSSSPSSFSLPVLFSRWRSKLEAMGFTDWVDVFLPCSRWVRTYRWREYLQVDLAAGLTVGVMLVPQVHFVSNFSCLLSAFVWRYLGKWREWAFSFSGSRNWKEERRQVQFRWLCFFLDISRRARDFVPLFYFL